jgi:hypothetical protein
MIRALKKDLLDIAQESHESDCKTLIRALRYINLLEEIGAPAVSWAKGR